MNRPWQYAARLSVWYLVISGVYIFVSGRIASAFAVDVADLERLEVVKGIVFVVLTASLLFLLSLRMFRRSEANAQAAQSAQKAFLVAQRRATAGLFASSVAHDFRNILMVLPVVSDQLRARVPAGDQRWLDELDAAFERARELAGRLMSAARPPNAEPAVTDLASLATEVLTLVRSHRAARSRDLRQVGEGAVLLRCQPALVHQMLTNLVLNAVQAVSDGGTVDVSVSGGDSEAVLVVEDDGPGVPESHRERLFEPFFTTRDEGMGLGLFSVSACVEQHHGSVVVSRSRLGGACFRIVLRPATRDGRSGSPDHREHTPAA